MNKINVYVDDNGDLHYVNAGGADSVIPFNHTLIDFGNEMLSYWKFFYLVETTAGSISFNKPGTSPELMISGSAPNGSGTKYGYVIYPYLINLNKVESITLTYEQHTTKETGSYGDHYPCWLLLFDEDTVLDNLISRSNIVIGHTTPSQQVYRENIMFETQAFNTENLSSPEQTTINIDGVNKSGYLGFCFKVAAGNGYQNNSWMRLVNIILND